MALGGLLASMSSPTVRRGLLNMDDPAAMANAQAPRQGGGILDRFNSFAGDNWETLLAMGLGGMQPTRAGSSAGMLQGLQTGAVLSDRRRTRAEEREERERQQQEKQAFRLALAGKLEEFPGEVTPADLALMEADPQWGLRRIDQLMERQSGGGAFEGTGMDQQSWNIILTRDPGSPEYAAAYNHLFEQPKMQSVQTADGLQFIPVMPQVPATVRPPAGRGAAPGQSPAAGLTSPPPGGQGAAQQQAAGPGGGIGAPILVPGTQARPQESMVRDRKLLTLVEPEFAAVKETYSSLAELGNQVAGAIPVLGNFVVSPEYQQARGHVQAIAQSYLYSLSGATAPVEEVNKIMASVLPTPGDDARTIQDKLARLGQYVEAIRSGANGGPVPDLRGGSPASGLTAPPGEPVFTSPGGARVFAPQ